MSKTFPNEFWNDSCRLVELNNAVSLGATGATSNPPLMLKAIQAEERSHWKDVIQSASKERSLANGEDGAWALMRSIAVDVAEVLKPIWDESNGRMGLLSVQVDPRRHSDSDFMVQQAININRLAPNLSIKIPATKAGLVAVEEIAALGVNTTATVSFSLPQVIQAAEAFRRGVSRFRRTDDTRPVQCFAVIMAGRLDDHLRDAADKSGVSIDEDVITKAGVAVVKKAYQIFQERQYESRLLVGAMRGSYHITDLIGGDVVLTTPPNRHDVFQDNEFAPKLDEPVDPAALQELHEKSPDFVRAYKENGMSPEEFESFGPSAKTLNQFMQAFNDIVAFAEGLIGDIA